MAIVVIIEEIMIVIAAQVMEVVEGWKVEVVRRLFGIRVKSCYHCVVGGTIPYLNA